MIRTDYVRKFLRHLENASHIWLSAGSEGSATTYAKTFSQNVKGIFKKFL